MKTMPSAIHIYGFCIIRHTAYSSIHICFIRSVLMHKRISTFTNPCLIMHVSVAHKECCWGHSNKSHVWGWEIYTETCRNRKPPLRLWAAASLKALAKHMPCPRKEKALKWPFSQKDVHLTHLWLWPRTTVCSERGHTLMHGATQEDTSDCSLDSSHALNTIT